MLAHSCLSYVKLFEYLADAKDTSMLENKHAAVLQAEASLAVILQNEHSFVQLLAELIFRICVKAAANSMNVVLQDRRSSLLDQSKLVEIVCALCHILTQSLRHLKHQNGDSLKGGPTKLQVESTAAGLPSALMTFTEAAWQALQQLDTNSCQQQQQQQQQQQRVKHKHRAKQHCVEQMTRCLTAAVLMERLPPLWEDLRSCLALGTAHQEALPLLMTIVTTAPTLLQQAGRTISCCCCNGSVNIPALPQFEQKVRDIADMGVPVALSVVVYLTLCPVQPQRPEVQQQYQQIVQADKLPELLLLLAAHLAAKMHKDCSGTSQVVQANRTAAARGHTTGEQQLQQQQQQQQQQDQPSVSCVVPPHHLTLLRMIGLGHIEEDFVFNVDVECVYASTLAAVHEVVLARLCTAIHLNSSSTDSANQDAAQQQQQQVGGDHNVLPSHLLVPAVKMLIEVLLLLPCSSNLSAYASTMKLIKLLLIASVTAPSPAAAATAAAATPWPQLPAAVAAGLLQPVIAQLSQAVICCLLQTDDHHEKQQQSSKQPMEAESQRLTVLHDYGWLVLVVCRAVEPKHIAAVLQSQPTPDLLITLVAIEAVIRAQACHLAPASLKHQQQQQQQQQLPGVYSTIAVGSNSQSPGVVWDITHCPPAHAPLLLLPFVSKVVESLESVFECLQKQDLTMSPTFGPGSVNMKLSTRLCTLSATALKVGTCAVAAAAPDQHEGISQQAMANAATVNALASCWCSSVQESTSRVPGAGTAVQGPSMPAGLMFRALQALSCVMTSWAARYDLQIAAATTAAMVELQPLSATAVGQSCADKITCTYTEFAGVRRLLQRDLTNAKSSLHNLAMVAGGNGGGGKGVAGALHCIQLAKEGADAPLVAWSVEGICGMLLTELEAGHELEGMPASTPTHLSASACELADAVVSWFPLTVCCNNPSCTNLTKLSEWQLVCGKACVCAGCEVARYCSRACQQQHWKLHKHVCSKLSAHK